MRFNQNIGIHWGVTVGVALLMCVPAMILAQSIRKDWREFSTNEKTAYVDALWALWDSGSMEGIIISYSERHFDEQCPIHGNITFLPWHRLFLRDIEEQLQLIDSSLTIPYWDWRSDRSPSSGLWSDLSAGGFLGEFDAPWNLGRQVGVYSFLPTDGQVNDALALTDFSAFAGGPGNMCTDPDYGQLELLHNSPHPWVGGFDTAGVMTTMRSPKDPVFYMHHGLIDKLWQDWENEHGASTFAEGTQLEGYEGVDPNDIVDSRDLDLWYAFNNLVILDQHTASTTSATNYRYTSGDIRAENDFVVPSGANCTFEASEDYAIVLKPGFRAEAGSKFLATITAGGGMGKVLTAKSDLRPPVHQSEGESDPVPLEHALGVNYPNPFNPITTITYSVKETGSVKLTVFDITGREVAVLVHNRSHPIGHFTAVFDASRLATGVYLYRLEANSFTDIKKLVLVK